MQQSICQSVKSANQSVAGSQSLRIRMTFAMWLMRVTVTVTDSVSCDAMSCEL